MGGELQGVRVLLVDDDEDTVALYSFALDAVGAEVRAALTATEALTSTASWRPAVIVSDLGIPGTDVGSLLRDLRAQHPAQWIPAVAVTGRSTPDDRAAAIALGFQEHAPKPLVPDDLVAIVAIVRGCASPS